MISWFAKNAVAVNFLMLAILAAGLYSLKNKVPLEVFPIKPRNQISISVLQRAATPQDIELGITNRIEEAVADLPYIDELSSRSSEQRSLVTIKLNAGTDRQAALNEVKTKVEALSTLPQTAERPIVEIPILELPVLNLMVTADADEKELAVIANKIRDNLVRIDGITLARVSGIRPYEISIEVSPATLRAYDLSLEQISEVVRKQAIDVSAGQLRTGTGEILLRSQLQAYTHDDYSNIIVKRFADGSVLRLGQIAHVNDGFDEDPVITRFNDKIAANVKVYRIGQESAISVSKLVYQHITEQRHLYPDSVEFGIWDDDSEIVKERLDTLLSSGWQGAILIMVLLTLFLHPTVAIWVVVGIPICFAGALALFPLFDMTLNMVSLFAFILVLGVVVDDAIVTGENIYSHRARGSSAVKAAIEGTQEIAMPVIFGVITTMLAFVPMLMLPEETRFFGENIAGVVIPVLIFSLIESKFILPSHLTHLNLKGTTTGVFRYLTRVQDYVSAGLDACVTHLYEPMIKRAVALRYVTVAVFVGLLLIVTSLISNGWIESSFMPDVESDTATANVTFPVGTPLEKTLAAIDLIEQQAVVLRDKYRVSGESVIRNIIATTGLSGGSGSASSVSSGASHLGNVQFEIDSEIISNSDTSIHELVDEWREAVGVIVGAEKLELSADLFNAGPPIYVQLRGNNVEELEAVARKLRDKLGSYDGTFDIDDSMRDGKKQLLITLKPEAEILGLTTQSLSTQVRNAFFGSEAQRIQRGRDDVRVMVRYPQAERKNLAQLDNLLIATPAGGEARFGDVAELEWSHSASNIYHINQLRTTTVEADIDRDKLSVKGINEDLAVFLSKELRDHPEVSYSFDGESKVLKEFMSSFMVGIAGVLLAILALLSIAFKSYYQPIIVMSVIPFSAIGAILGHTILGVGWTMFSYFGLLALVGVVINDSLVLVDWINRRVAEGLEIKDLALAAGRARFRAVLLTSLTTFFGLLPILFQTSIGSAFLKPMAISLAFGILFATFLTLVLVPCNYMILEDVRGLKRRLMGQTNPTAAISEEPVG